MNNLRIAFNLLSSITSLKMRLDFSQFLITGPSTSTVTVGSEVNGRPVQTGAGKAYTLQTQCL